MNQKRDDNKPAADTDRTPAAPAPELPAPQGHQACTPHCVEVTGKMPEGIRVDPDITEGHPGYQESGDSEIIPPKQLATGDRS